MKTIDAQATLVVLHLCSPRFEECQQRVLRNAHCGEFNSTPQAPTQSKKGIIPSCRHESVEKIPHINRAYIYVKRKQLLEKQRLVQEAIIRVQSPTSIMDSQQLMGRQSIPQLGILLPIESAEEFESCKKEFNYLPSRIWEHTSESGKEKSTP